MQMNGKTKEKYAGFMGIIENEILKRQGSGFTVELYPEVISAMRYEGVSRLFSDKNKWQLPVLDHDLDEHTITNVLMYKVDLSCRLRHEVERNLPKEIVVEKSFPTVILDEREYKDPNRTGAKAYRIVGRRVYVTVPNDYASKIFRDTYINIGLPFRDVLLTQHSKILNEIVGFTGTYRFTVTTHGITRGNFSFCGEDDPRDYLTFEKLGMLPLNSNGQMYGMAMAIVETIKKQIPSMRDCILEMKRGTNNGIEVWLRGKQEEPKELKEW